MLHIGCCSSLLSSFSIVTSLIQKKSFMLMLRARLCVSYLNKVWCRPKYHNRSFVVIRFLLCVQNVDHLDLHLHLVNAFSPTFYQHLHTVSNLLYLTFQQKYLSLGLIKNYVIWNRAVPKQHFSLFLTSLLLLNCHIRGLWSTWAYTWIKM